MNKILDESPKEYSFFEHIYELRKRLLWFLLVYIFLFVVSFIFIEFIFKNIILSPLSENFITFKSVCRLGELLNISSLCNFKVNFRLINIEMAGQFTAHLKISFISSLVLSFPFLLFQVWNYIKPALYTQEKKYFISFILFGSLLFFVGISFAYFVVLPMAVMFLGNYQVNPNISNHINIKSYISFFSSTVFLTGVLFLLPLVIAILTKIGILNPLVLKKFRRHGIVVSFIFAAIITPTSDIFTLCLVAIPLVLLYEFGILISKKIDYKTII